MIKKLFSIALVTVAVSSNAQQLNIKAPSVNPKAVSSPFNLTARTESTTDTLRPVTFQTGGCASTAGTAYYYPIDRVAPTDTGYVFGSNSFPYAITTPITATLTITNSESAQKYHITGNATVTGVLVGTAKASSSAATTMIKAKIYSETAGTLIPNAVLGTSTARALNSFTPAGLNLLTFGTPVAITNQNFFASVTCPYLGGSTHDTLAILGSSAGTCSSTDSLSWIYQQAFNGASSVQNKWYSVNYYFGHANLDLMIFPIINIASGIDKVTKGNLSLFAAYPNPANNAININFSLDNTSKVEIEIYDLTGKLVKSISNNDVLSTGKHAISVDLSNFEAGSYLYSINANGNKMFSKFVVTK